MTERARQERSQNLLLASVPRAVLDALAPDLTVVPLQARTVLAEPGVAPQFAYFPHAGVICLMAALRKGIAETATVGPEGFVGFETLLGGRSGIQRVLVQVGGAASRIPIKKLLAAAERHPQFKARLLDYVRYFVVQILQSVACNGLHTVNQRCARWLLMAHDRARSDSFNVTHRFLAEMLGIHRPSVTIVARRLQRAGLIRYSRGKITIVDRRGLERAACECYGIVRKALEETVENGGRTGRRAPSRRRSSPSA